MLFGCESTPENDAKWQAFGAALAGGAAAYSAGYNSASYTPVRAPVYDSEWDWDQFYHNNVLVWACRGVQTGQFAYDSNCAYKAKLDFRWPDKWLSR